MNYFVALAGVLFAGGLLWAETPPAPPSVPASASDAAGIDPAVIDILRKAFAAQKAKGSFRAKLEIPNAPGGGTATMEIEFVFPDRMRMNLSGVEVISVGDRAFMRLGDKWMPAPPQVTKAGGSFGDPKMVEEMIRNCTGARVLGPETVNGIPMETYEFLAKTKEGTSKSKFYITPGDSLPRRIDIEGTVVAKDGQVRTRLDYSDYGAPISIEPPKDK